MKQNKNVVKLTESQLKQIVAESVMRILKEASMGRGTSTITHSTFNGTLRWKNEPYDWSNTYRTEENPYSNDTVMMLAKRLEKRLGGEYEVTAYCNTYGHEKDDANNKPKTYKIKADFRISRNYNRRSSYRQEDFDVEFIVKTAKQILSNMSERVYLSNVEKHDGDNLFDDFVSSITISAILFVDTGVEPRKDMMPRRGVKEVPGEYLARGTGYADSNFKKG